MTKGLIGLGHMRESNTLGFGVLRALGMLDHRGPTANRLLQIPALKRARALGECVL
jgi:hypothetical protein